MITPEEFALGCQRLAHEWDRWLPEEPRWHWELAAGPFSASLGGGYLAMHLAPRQAVVQSGGGQGAAERDTPNLGAREAAIEKEQEETCAASQVLVHLYAHHIVYSPSFGVPVMYFEGQDPGGSPLVLAQVLAHLGLGSLKHPELAGAIISQEEHPFLKRPFFMLHPCQTDEIMRIVTEAARSRGAAIASPLGITEEASHMLGAAPAAGWEKIDPLLYMMAWLSVAGRVFGLQLPLAAWKEYRRAAN